ncbi:MAG: 4-hydroxy-tetrahydrodipicolinate synthase [Planctomycetota bacterium]
MTARKGSDFAGVGVAIVTPFKEGVLDVARLKQQIEFQIASGTTFLVPAGTTGESPTLTHDEHERVISEVVQLASGRCKVMAGTGSNCTAEALRLTRWAAKAGADASLQVAPYYNKPTQRGFYEHFKAIAEDVGIPHCVYNIPGRSAKNIEPETIAKLAELKNITMVKEATGSLDQCSQILNTTNLTVLSGDDSLTLPMMSIGAQGVISVAGNIVPGDLLAMVKAALAGDFALASKLHHRLFPLCRDMLSLATNPIPVKGAMKLLGRDTGELRLPMTELEPKEFDALRATLLKYGILK